MKIPIRTWEDIVLHSVEERLRAQREHRERWKWVLEDIDELEWYDQMCRHVAQHVELGKCDCGKEKHGFMDHVTGCPAGEKV